MITGIIGFGRFGQLWAQALSPFGKVKVYDKHDVSMLNTQGIEFTSLEDALQSDRIFLLIPISEFQACCESIRPYLKPKTLVIDGCSVKLYPAAIMQQTFSPQQPIIATHPLFGPDSVQRSGGFQGHSIVMCPIQYTEQQQAELQQTFDQLGLRTIITTPEEHDRQMAHSQGLVHLIGRGLAALDLQPQPIATPDFQALLNINQMVIHDTWQLFLDMHRYNPFTQEIRKKFIHQLTQLTQEINIITVDQPTTMIVEQATPTLEQLREKINQTDAAIIQKLSERQKLSKQVSELKAKTGMAILDSKREEALMRYYETLSAQYGLDPEFVKTVFKMIIAHSRDLQKKG